MSKYDFGLDLDTENSISLMIGMIKTNSRVLEFGPANGRMTKYLSEKMLCRVDIVEIDEESGKEASKYSNKSYIGSEMGNIENFRWFEELKSEKYDYIIFADVLEHLHAPIEVLKKCNRILKDNGSIILSVPNIAHNSVIINLVNDEFKYTEIGLLDNTHISFFSYKSLKRMIHEAGYRAMNEKGVYSRVGENEINNSYSSISNELAKALREREKGNIYQFVFELKKKDYTLIESSLRTVNLDGNSEYEFVCYIKEKIDDEYSEFKTIRKFIKPKHNIIKFELTNFREVHEIRIDPIDANCVINIKDIYTIIDGQKISLNIECTNGVNLYDSVYMFTTNDPQIYLNINTIKVNELYYECEFIDYDSELIYKYEEMLKRISLNNNNILEQKNNIIIDQKKLIEEKEEINEFKEQIIEDTKRKIEDKEQIIKDKEMYIKEMENSKVWKIVKWIKKVIDR
ncbi:class I SAM-dependent methyltransferase [Clostridium beijerinckii]|uniref:class I SAM-dependent methyltransferase n=1 Tax=Clostridium beijerinckii TaxID=1520 RepID=UPI00232C72AC|nr:class I SAM-dependent methyltransferase [Clostridium beijerinckii]